MGKVKTPYNFIDLCGKSFGQLLVLSVYEPSRGKVQLEWWCKCYCGKTTVKKGQSLRDGRVKTCGCGKLELENQRLKKLKELHKNLEFRGNRFKWSGR